MTGRDVGSTPTRCTMTTDEKCAAILKKILEIVNKGDKFDTFVKFTQDWGGNGATIEINGSHTHVGWTDFTWEQYVDSLYNTICNDKGLSWCENN